MRLGRVHDGIHAVNHRLIQPGLDLRSARERERAERYRGVYTTLGLRVVAHEDGTLELTWKAGEGVSEKCVSPRCRDVATIS